LVKDRPRRQLIGPGNFYTIQPSSSYGREESSKTVKKVSWLEMAMQDAQKGKDSRNRVSSKKGPIHTTGIASVSEGATVVADPV
jgi:hypothetical protein